MEGYQGYGSLEDVCDCKQNTRESPTEVVYFETSDIFYQGRVFNLFMFAGYEKWY
jgi:hypothetical protein